jgi:NADH-quinone oxidoreductase subunit M
LSSIGLPGTNGFIGEFLVLVGSFTAYPFLTMFATTGVIFAAAYLLWAIQRILFNPLDKPENRHIPDLNWREIAIVTPLIVAIVWIGVYPAPILRRMEPASARLVEQVHGGAVPPSRLPGAAVAVIPATADNALIRHAVAKAPPITLADRP